MMMSMSMMSMIINSDKNNKYNFIIIDNAGAYLIIIDYRN